MAQQLTCALTIFLAFIFYVEANTTDVTRTDTTDLVTQSNTTDLIMSSSTARPDPPHYVLPPPRRAVLVLQADNEPLALRHRSAKKYTALKYMEYDNKGALLNQVMMYNLKDVADFFDVYLGTKICYEKC